MRSGTPTAAELEAARDWFDRHLPLPHQWDEETVFPCSFRLDGAPWDWREWEPQAAEMMDGRGLISRTLTFTHPGGLRARLQITSYHDFPVLEWLLTFENTGSSDSPLVSEILPLDLLVKTEPAAPYVLSWAKGSLCLPDDFAPQETPLAPGASTRLGTEGRSSNGTLPFFNLCGAGEGLLGAIGWTGGWRLEAGRGEDGSVHLRAGMQRTHLRLHPGEAIRSPRIMLLPWQGEARHGHNLLRRFILQHRTPRPNDQLLVAPICNAVWGENQADNQIAKARWWREHELPLDYFWIDAGWYGDGAFREDSTVFNSEWALHVGNWWPNRGPYPEGLRPVGEALRDLGLGFVLWFEPERVRINTHFVREHPEWLLGPLNDDYLFDLGIPEARAALTDLLSGLIAEAGVTCYRQDFNFDPHPYWAAADAPDRVGMSEIRHIEGLYAMWDELLARHPGLIIDNCSSGGRRIDLETISRSIPLWRSDVQCWPQFDPVTQQGQTQGLAPWVPLSTGCCEAATDYAFRSALGPGLVLTGNLYDAEVRDFAPVDWLRARLQEQRRLRPYFYGDFYPLLQYSLSNEAWALWQWDRPDLGEGCLIALRRPQSPFTTVEAKLSGLDEAARYEVRDPDGGEAEELTAAKLREGIAVSIAAPGGTKILVYRKLG